MIIDQDINAMWMKTESIEVFDNTDGTLLIQSRQGRVDVSKKEILEIVDFFQLNKER